MKNKQLIRLKFRDSVFSRDGNKCAIPGCGCTENLDAHHITNRTLMPNGGYVKENGISLCPDHHLMAEKFHISNGIEWHENMHPNDLYKLINSNYDLAVKCSERLK